MVVLAALVTAATITGGLAPLIESAASELTGAVYRNRAPQGAPLPRLVVLEGIVTVVDRAAQGDVGGGGAVPVRDTVQLDLWQRSHDPETGALVEDATLAGRVMAALDGARWAMTTGVVYGIEIGSRIRVPDDDPLLVHDAITATVRRNL